MSAMPNESCLYILCFAYTFRSLVFMDTVDAHHRVSEDYSIIKAATFVHNATDSTANTIQSGQRRTNINTTGVCQTLALCHMLANTMLELQEFYLKLSGLYVTFG